MAENKRFALNPKAKEFSLPQQTKTLDWFETILPHRMITLITTFFEPEEQFMYAESDDTIGPYVRNLPKTIKGDFAHKCARKGLLMVLRWGIDTNRIVWASRTATVISIEAATHGQQSIIEFAEMLCDKSDQHILWRGAMSGSLSLISWLHAHGYDKKASLQLQTEVLHSLLGREKTAPIDLLAKLGVLNHGLQIYTIVKYVAKTTTNPEMLRWCVALTETKYRGSVNVERLAIDAGNISMLMVYWARNEPSNSLWDYLQWARDASVQNPDLVKWLQTLPQESKSWGRTVRPVFDAEYLRWARQK